MPGEQRRADRSIRCSSSDPKPTPPAVLIASCTGRGATSCSGSAFRACASAAGSASCAGEMLDWEAPTGGYLLTACLATGRAAGRGALAWVAGQAAD